MLSSEEIRNKKKEEEEEEHGKKTIPLDIYPVLLEVLRPKHLYQFLQNENH